MITISTKTKLIAPYEVLNRVPETSNMASTFYQSLRPLALLLLCLCTIVTPSLSLTGEQQQTCNNTCNFVAEHGHVNCRNKALVRIPRNAGACNEATTLDMRNNVIDQVQPNDILQYHFVRILRLGGNSISYMQANMYGNSSSLVQLDLNNNHIRSIPSEAFQNLHSLTELFLDSNDIDDIEPDAFDGLSSLNTLILNDNQITEIPPGLFRDLKALVKLNIANNNIVQITGQVLTGLFSLKQLNFQGNRISSVGPETFQSLTSLEKIELDGNGLVSLDATTFIKLPLLQELILNDNNLTTIKNTRLWLLTKAGSLKKLSLARNPLHCNCDLEPIRIWYRENNPNNEDAVCVSPPELEGPRLAAIDQPLCDEPIHGQTSPRLLITTVQERGSVGNIGGLKPQDSLWQIVIITCGAFIVLVLLVTAFILVRRRRGSRSDSEQTAPMPVAKTIDRQPRQRLTSASPLMPNEDAYSEVYTIPPDARSTPKPNITSVQTPRERAPLVKQASTGSVTTAQDIIIAAGNGGSNAVPHTINSRQRQFSINEPDIPEVEIEFDSAGQACKFRRPSSPETIYESVQPRQPFPGTISHKTQSPRGTNTGYLPLPNAPQI